MTHAVQILLLGLALGGVYALMASGLTLIFGVMGIVNLAHAAFMTVPRISPSWRSRATASTRSSRSRSSCR
jgi:branched-chain amino acid transport system permease protein